MDKPRIGVFLCDCAGQISDRIETSRVEAAARQLDGVAHVCRRATLCGSADLEALGAEVEAHGVERVLFAGCSARTSLKYPEERLVELLEARGIDRGHLEVANLREGCAWMHEDAEAATRKAIDLVRMGHARLRSSVPRAEAVAISSKALVIGGGPAGLQAAKSLASAGQEVTLVERDTYLGGRLCQIGFLFQCEGWASYCRSDCVGPVQAMEAILDPRITVLMQSEVTSLATMNGSFNARIRTGAPFVDPDRCISCGECATVCPEETVSRFNEGLYRRKAIDKDFERAVPDHFTVIDEACTRCGECVPVCPTEAINLSARPDLIEESFGAVFMATGYDSFDVSTLPELGSPAANVVTGMQMERIMEHGLARPSDGEQPERVVFNLCSGSRATLSRRGKGVPYCSKTCCGVTVKQAERILARNPMAEVIILYNDDIRAYERALEEWYARLKGMGVEMVNAQLEQASEQPDGSVGLRLRLAEGEEPDIDDVEIADGVMTMDADLLVLAAAQVPRQGSEPLLEQLGVLRDAHGFPRETQVRLFRPTETCVDRVFAVGASVGPKVVQQAVEQGSAAAMRALPVLSEGLKRPGTFTSAISPEQCIRCRTCMAVCPHGAIRMTPEGAVSDPAFCQGCGFCAAACPTHAAQLPSFSDQQLLDQVAVAFDELPEGEPRILALLCYWCSYAGCDMAGIKRMSLPASFRAIRIRCSSSVSSGLLLELLRRGVDGILVAGCPDRGCHHAWGNYLSDRRITLMRSLMAELGVAEGRLRFETIGVPQSQKLLDTITAMDTELRTLGPSPIPTLVRS